MKNLFYQEYSWLLLFGIFFGFTSLLSNDITLPRAGTKGSNGHYVKSYRKPKRPINAIDPIGMSIQADKVKPKVGEPIELTITARYLNLHPSLLFTFQGSNAFRIKVIVPDGFVVTGGTYQDYIGDNLTPDHPHVSYTITGHFTKIPEQSQFRLLRGGADANEQSIFVLKSQVTLDVKPSNASMARSGDCFVNSPMGAFDFISCSQMSGWALDRADLSQTLQIDIYIDGVLTYPGIIANLSRPDLVVGFNNPAARLHGYSYTFPADAPWKDGKSHSFIVRICGVVSDVGGSPKTINGCMGTATCTPPQSPTLSASNGNQLCNGAVTLTASGCSGTVNWSTGVTSTSISVSTAANYTATCTQNNCTSPASAITVSNCSNQDTGLLVSGSCYTIQSQQNSNLVQAVGGAAQFQTPNNQTNQVWLAESVANNAYKFTIQDGSRQALYVDALSDGRPLKLGAYQAEPRYQWTLEKSTSGGYRVFGGSSQNTWDYQGGGIALQLYGSNASQSDGSWNQSYRRFSFSSASCPTSTTTTPPATTTATSTTTTSTTTTTATLNVSPSSVNAGTGASSQAITVTSNSSWSVSTGDNAWLTLSSTSGSGNGGFTINLANNGGSQRTASVSVSGGGQTQTITVTQAASASGGCNTNTTPLAGEFNYAPFAPSSIPGNYIVTQENGTVKLELNLKEGNGATNGLAGGILSIWDKLHAGGPQNTVSNPIFGPGNCGDCGNPPGTMDVGSGNQIALYRTPRSWNYNGVLLPNGDNPTEYGAANTYTSKLNQYGRGTINGATADYTNIDPAQWEGNGQMLTGDRFEKWVSVQGNEIKIWYQETLSRNAQTGANNEQSYPRNQEAPCLYANANLGKTVFYDGDAPYTNGQVRSMQLTDNISMLNGQSYLTENWIAVIGEDGRGIGMIFETPIAQLGQLGSTINNAAGTGFGRNYISWQPKLTIDANIIWRHSVVEVVGTIAEIRQAAYNYTQSRYSATPEYRFNQAGRQLWSMENCTDPGYVASRNSWPVTFKTNGAKITSPAAAWSGSNKKVYMRYRYTSTKRSQASVTMQWRRARQSDAFPPTNERELGIWNQQFPDGSAVGPNYTKSTTLNANGQWNIAEFDMSNMADWKGIITELIFKSDDNSANETLEIEWISASTNGPCLSN